MKKYLELRYRLMPYIYTAARETSETGLPMMRAMWLHHPDDPAAVARGDQFFWGRDLLVAPVVEKGATHAQRVSAARHVVRLLDRRARSRAAGRSIARSTSRRRRFTCAPARSCRWDPLKQYTDEPVDGPLTLHVYPGVDGASPLYEDDGRSFGYRKGQFMRIETRWDDQGAAAAAGARAGIEDAGAARAATIEVDGCRHLGDDDPSRSPASRSRCGCDAAAGSRRPGLIAVVGCWRCLSSNRPSAVPQTAARRSRLRSMPPRRSGR